MDRATNARVGVLAGRRRVDHSALGDPWRRCTINGKEKKKRGGRSQEEEAKKKRPRRRSQEEEAKRKIKTPLERRQT
jgi:hypothetical protein